MWFRGRRLAAVALLAVSLLAGCAVNPVTGERELSVLSSREEAQIGRQAAAEVAAGMGLVKDPALVSYVRALGARLAARSPRKDLTYQFFVADDPTPNAFALPGGYVYVTRGLLALTNSEAELAGVIGHEIGHVAARHAAQRKTRALGVGLLSVLGTLAGAALGGQGGAEAASELGQVAGAGYIASYGRDQERQADEVGQRLAADAGYAPDGISRFLLTLQREERLRKPGREPGPAFLDSHPATEERVEATLARARSLRVAPDAPLSPDASAFLGRLEGLTVGADPADGVFVGDRFLHPVLDFSIEFPAGWHARNQRHAVLAAPSAGDALLQLEEEAAALDPSRLARDFLAQNRLEPQQPRSLRIGGFPAYRALAEAQGPQGPLGLDLTWIALPRGALRLIGVAPLHRFAAHAGRLAATAQSLRALTPEDRARIRGRRLHIVRAEPGETLIALARRAGNRWSVEETAVANGLEPTTPLAAGRPIKTVVERPYP